MAFDPSLIPSSNKLTLTLDSSQITTDQVGFPLTVHLDGTDPLHGAIFTELGVSSKKLSIEADGVQCPVEIESWDSSSGKAALHIKVPTYSATVDTELVLSFDSSQADNDDYVGMTGEASSQNVWDDNFIYVSHQAQDPSGIAPQLLDSTSKGIGGTSYGSMTSGDLVDGVTGKMIEYDGVNDYFILDDPLDTFNAIPNALVFTIEAIVKIDALSSRGCLVGNTATTTESGYNITWQAGGYFRLFVAKGTSGTPVIDAKTNTGLITDNDIHSLAITGDASQNVGFFVDGSREATVVDSAFTSFATGNADRNTCVGDYSYPSTLDPWNGVMGEIRISDITRSDDWLALTSLSLTDQLITFSPFGVPVAGVLLRTVLEQGYDLSYDIVAAVLEQSYSVSGDVEISSEQIYSMLLEIWGMQYYGDVSWLKKQLTQYYGSAAILQKSLSQRWGEALELTIDLEQNWSMPDLLQIISDQHYGITSDVLRKTSEQLYHINQLSTLFAASHQAYAIAGEVAAVYRFDTKLFVDGEQIPFSKLQWESSENDYFWSCEAVVANKEVAVKCADGAELRIDWAGESCFFKCYDGWMLDKRFGSESYRIKGFSKAKDLYYAGKLSGDIAGGMASQLVADLASSCGITIDWQMDDGYIQSGKLVANDESPLDVIRKIVWDCKGKLRPTLDGNLIAVYEEEIAVPDYPTTTPADTIIARMERISTSESRDEQQGYNKFTVSDQLASDESRNLVKDMIDSRTAELREYATPLYQGLEFELSHKGPVSVSIEPFGLVEKEIEDELIIFENGSARTSLPIYAITKRSWQTVSLGLVSFSEDGLLTAEVKEYGLLRLSYITKYFRWIAKHPSVADVLFTADEVSQ